MCASMVDIQSAMAEIRRGKKKGKKEQTTGWKYIWPALLHRAAIMNPVYRMYFVCMSWLVIVWKHYLISSKCDMDTYFIDMDTYLITATLCDRALGHAIIFFPVLSSIFFLLWPPYVIEQAIYIFILSFLLSFFPRLISAVGDWISTILPHMVWP